MALLSVRVGSPRTGRSLTGSLCLQGRPLETLHHQAHPIPPHEAPAGVCEPQEWGQPGMHSLPTAQRACGGHDVKLSPPIPTPQLFTGSTSGFCPIPLSQGSWEKSSPVSPPRPLLFLVPTATGFSLCCSPPQPATPDCPFPVPLGSCPSQGAKIIQSFLWYLNPRQVFDLSQGGPKEA